jgi:hypothetical protein
LFAKVFRGYIRERIMMLVPNIFSWGREILAKFLFSDNNSIWLPKFKMASETLFSYSFISVVQSFQIEPRPYFVILSFI